MISPETYAIERAICDKAESYWQANAKFSKGGWSSLVPEKSKHPDYAACDNAMRGRVEQFELARDKPENFIAYIVQNESGCWRLTTWTGDALSSDLIAGRSYRNPRASYTSDTLTPIRAKTLWGDWYYGRALGVGMYVKLRKCNSKA